ncbi:MAG: hypothetical protein DHS20C02_08440 [Micavibrio sp.]|nr:MAG: hypothetical protein DHS20C02_08440 [Micavibrio sp.]
MFFFYLPYGLALFLGVIALFFVWRNYVLHRHYKLLEDSINTPAHGLVFFDEKGRFHKANVQAHKYVPFLENKNSSDLCFDGFLNYLYDHAMDCDESLEKAIEGTAGKMTSQGFREVIEWGEGNICLAEVQKTKDKSAIVVLNDISDLKKQEENFLRLNRYSHELSQAIEAAALGIVISDPKQSGNAVIYVNEPFCRLAQMKREEVIGNDWAILLGALDDSNCAESLVGSIVKGEQADIEAEITTDGGARWFNIKLTPVRDRKDQLDLFIGVFTDVTEQKQREAEAFQGKKLEALGQLAAGIAHDFNNILSIVDGYIRMADNELEEDSKAANFLQHSRKATKRGAELTKRMLMFSRHKIIAQSVVDLREVVRDQEPLLQPLLDASVSCVVRTCADDICIECGPDTVGQILMNLAINARDAMPDGGTFLVEVKMAETEDLPVAIPVGERGNSFARLSVSDTGTGMDKKTVDRIFDPFFTTKEQGKGTGLGLSMVYGLVQETGGYIGVQSFVGRGTTISIYIPLTDKEPTKQIKGDATNIKDLRLEGYTVLVAEDEPDLRLVVCDMLEKLGMTVLQAENGNEALAKQEDFEGQIDILLTDVVMPELNGVKLAELFQSLREETKIIFMSGYPANGNMARVELPEDAYFMAKPLEYELLARLMYQRLRENDSDNPNEGPAIESARWKTGGDAEG